MPGNLVSINPTTTASWPEPNYTDPVRRRWLPAYASVLQAVATLMLGTRFVLRLQKKAGPPGLDDALLIPASVFATMFTTLIIIDSEWHGADRHMWDVPPGNYVSTVLLGWLSELSFLISTSCTKISVLLFYRRLAKGLVAPFWKIATISAIVFTAVVCVLLMFALIFDCQPTAAYWKSYGQDYTENYHCIDAPFLNLLSGVLSVLSDLYSVLLPMVMLRRFEATKQQRCALNAVFSLGLLVVGAGIVRTYYLARLGSSSDITWLGYDVYIWAQLEIQLSIICASAPALRVLFRRYFNRVLGDTISGDGGTARDSKLSEVLGIVDFRHRRSVREIVEQDEVGIMKQAVIETSEQTDVRSETPISPVSGRSDQFVKSAGDYECYVLESLHKCTTSRVYQEWRRPREEPQHVLEADATRTDRISEENEDFPT